MNPLRIEWWDPLYERQISTGTWPVVPAVGQEVELLKDEFYVSAVRHFPGDMSGDLVSPVVRVSLIPIPDRSKEEQ